MAEKEVVARAISAALPHPENAKNGNGCITQGEYLITWLNGHILTLKSPEEYDEQYSKWNIEQLPINFDNWDTSEMDAKRQRCNNIREWLKTADTVIHAGDPDQEGQLLVDEVLRKYNYRGKVLRINTSNTTLPGITRALAVMDSNDNHISRGLSAYARSVADFMVGINMSRLFTCMNNVKLTVGRVQTPTLGLVVARDAIIEGHQKVKYYTINVPVIFDSPREEVLARFVPDKQAEYLEDGKILDKDIAVSIAKKLEGKALNGCIDVSKEIVEEKPPLPLNMVKLQSYCGKKYNMNLERTMNASQSLRDKYNAITYNRSDCQYITEDDFAAAPDTMKTVGLNIKFYPKEISFTTKPACVVPSVPDHPAIIPTNQRVDLSVLTEDEKNTYLAVVKFYMAQFMPPATKEVTRLLVPLDNGDKLTAVSTTILKPGYRKIFSDIEKEDTSTLSTIPEGHYSGKIAGPTIEEKETKPPPRYTQTSLAEDMTCISKYVKDERIKRILREKDKDSKGENGSIGTVATRTAIITGLIKNGFLQDDGKYLRSTDLGRELFRILPDEIKKVDMTAEWWLVCEEIVANEATPKKLQDSVFHTIEHIIQNRDSYPKVSAQTAASAKTYGGKPAVGVCPRCGSPVVEGKTGFGCLGYKQGCKFVIWKESKASLFKGVKFSAKDAAAFLAGKKVKKELYSAAKEKSFTGYLKMNDSGGKDSQYGPKFDLSFEPDPAEKKRAAKRGSPERKTAARKNQPRKSVRRSAPSRK